VIRCSHCGKLVPAGATSCQSCGMPLTTTSGGTGIAGQGQTEQQELPAWLESLRAHEKPVPNNAGAQPFTINELVDENATPSWMRQDQSRLTEAGASDALPVVSPGGNGLTFSNSLEASSLIDQQSLPTWLRGAQEQEQQPTSQGFSASSLVQQDDLPPWMKNLAPAAEPQMSSQREEERYGLPTQTPTMPPLGSVNIPQTPQMPQTPQPMRSPIMPQTPVYSELSPAQGFLAHSLVDQQAVPDWLKGVQGSGGVQNTSGPLGSGFAAGELIDQRTLPNWMKEQQGRGNVDPVSAMGMPVVGSGQRTDMGQGMQGGSGDVGIPASTLLDKNALPTWMNQDMPKGANSGFTQGQGMQGTPQNGMAAGSLIDINSMPAWMKNMENTGTRGGATRAEGMRVPSRPRGDVMPQGQSTAAASTFASMLGVSASVPLLPGQNPAQESYMGVGQGPQAQQGQPQQPNWQASQQPVGNQSAPPWPPLQPQGTDQAWSPPSQPQAPEQSWSPPPPQASEQSWSSAQQMAAEQSWQAFQQQAANQSGSGWQSSGSKSGQAWQAANSPLPQGNWAGAPAPQPIPNNAQPRNSLSGIPGNAPSSSGSEANKAAWGQNALGVGSNQSGEAENTKKKGVFDAIRDFFFH
jgi:hypothetical protein